MVPAGLEPAIPESEQPQTHALDRAATGIRVGCIGCMQWRTWSCWCRYLYNDFTNDTKEVYIESKNNMITTKEYTVWQSAVYMRAVEKYGEVEVELHMFLNSEPGGGEWWASNPGHFPSSAHWSGGWVGSRVSLHASAKSEWLLIGLAHSMVVGRIA